MDRMKTRRKILTRYSYNSDRGKPEGQGCAARHGDGWRHSRGGDSYGGTAPGLAAGAYGGIQVNVRIPDHVSVRRDVPASIGVGSTSSQAGVTPAVTGCPRPTVDWHENLPPEAKQGQSTAHRSWMRLSCGPDSPIHQPRAAGAHEASHPTTAAGLPEEVPP
jgi:hypothetical protein